MKTGRESSKELPMNFDRADVRILSELQRDARTKATDLAETVGLSLSPFYRRIRMFEEQGVITQYVTLLDQEKAGYPVSAYVQVEIEKKTEAWLEAFEMAIAQQEEVMECYLTTASFDYMLRVVAVDILGIERFD